MLQSVVFFFEVELETHELGRTEGELDELRVQHAFEGCEVVIVEVSADVFMDVWSKNPTHQRVLHYESLRRYSEVPLIDCVEPLRYLWYLQSPANT